MISRANLLGMAAASAAVVCLGAPAMAQGTIKIGELNSYKSQPAFLEPYKKGWSWRSKRSTPTVASSGASSR